MSIACSRNNQPFSAVESLERNRTVSASGYLMAASAPSIDRKFGSPPNDLLLPLLVVQTEQRDVCFRCTAGVAFSEFLILNLVFVIEKSYKQGIHNNQSP